MFGKHVDVVFDKHDVAYVEAGIHTAGSVGYKEVFHSQCLENTDWKCYLFHVVPFVIVESSLHGQHPFAAQIADDEFPTVPLYGRDGEIGDLCVWNFGLVGNLPGKFSKSGS